MLRRGCALLIVLFVALLMAMVVTCPKASDHKEVLKTVLKDATDEKIGKALGEDLFSSVMKVAGQMTVGTTTDMVVDRLLRVDDYYLFSVGRVFIAGREYTVSVGVLNHVFAPDKEDVLKLVERYGI
ncbi:hypothetical protein L6475_04140 [Prevotella sp. E9-3]|uniref:hypothetical protein n=1 Tax=Prevotella sp. E9-3 TaxID=2913621 RepID=UPI001EDB90B6|nr:hypothetical protein [Prevotella sp. E9-3]UKK49157.1 hypothetical protein L6475_04140 [Prevotella sp. E9-3]